VFETDTKKWAEKQFSGALLGDVRLTKRLINLTTDLANNVGMSIGKAAKDEASLEGGYRFIENDNVDPQAIAEAGFRVTAQACAERRLVLLLEDTTGLTYKHSVFKELGDNPCTKKTLRGNNARTRSLFLHSVLAMDADTEAVIGLAHQQNYIRIKTPKMSGSVRSRRPKEEKESYRWEQSSDKIDANYPRTDNVLHVSDRETDSYEYMAAHISKGRRFIVRASHNRKFYESSDTLHQLKAAPVVFESEVKIAQKGTDGKKMKNRPARIAKVGVSYHNVTLKRPHDVDKAEEDRLNLNVVVCHELADESIDEASKLCWYLYTNEPINSMEDAQKILRYYELRWRIEDFHKVWKTDGTRVEELRVQYRDNLERLSTILAFIAVRLMQLKEIAENREQAKEQSCETMLAPLEWKMLWKQREAKPLPGEPPSLYWAYYALAKLGGWYDSKRTGRVGVKAIWDGWVKLVLMLQGYRIMMDLE
jgi:hypothetical protein